MYTRQRTYAGLSMELEVRARNRKGNLHREKRQNPTPEAMQNYNDKMAERNLRLLIGTNFGKGCGHFVLTYDGETPDIHTAKDKIVPNFVERLRRRLKKQGKELKYIIVTEYEAKRIHHHMILNTLDLEMVTDVWREGFVRVTPLDRSGDYRRLAHYLIKETKRTFRKYGGKRWSPSKNLEKPKFEKPKEVKRWNVNKPPREYKGYRLIDWEVTVNPVTGFLHQFAYYLKN